MHRALFNWVSWNQIIAITTANHEMDNITRSQWKLVEQTSTLPEVRENASEQVAICFSFESDLLRKWCEFSGPNTKRKKAKANQSRITFEIIGNCSETKKETLDETLCEGQRVMNRQTYLTSTLSVSPTALALSNGPSEDKFDSYLLMLCSRMFISWR